MHQIALSIVISMASILFLFSGLLLNSVKFQVWFMKAPSRCAAEFCKHIPQRPPPLPDPPDPCRKPRFRGSYSISEGVSQGLKGVVETTSSLQRELSNRVVRAREMSISRLFEIMTIISRGSVEGKPTTQESRLEGPRLMADGCGRSPVQWGVPSRWTQDLSAFYFESFGSFLFRCLSCLTFQEN